MTMRILWKAMTKPKSTWLETHFVYFGCCSAKRNLAPIMKSAKHFTTSFMCFQKSWMSTCNHKTYLWENCIIINLRTPSPSVWLIQCFLSICSLSFHAGVDKNIKHDNRVRFLCAALVGRSHMHDFFVVYDLNRMVKIDFIFKGQDLWPLNALFTPHVTFTAQQTLKVGENHWSNHCWQLTWNCLI